MIDLNTAMKPQNAEDYLKGGRKTLHVLQPAAGDKENLVGPGRMVKPDGKSQKEILADIVEGKKNENLSVKNSKRKCVEKNTQTLEPTVTVEDLTSEEGPSENYWEILAEKRRVVLEETLCENRRLLDKIELLEEKNKVMKDMLEESEHLVEILKEMLGDDEKDTNESSLLDSINQSNASI